MWLEPRTSRSEGEVKPALYSVPDDGWKMANLCRMKYKRSSGNSSVWRTKYKHTSVIRQILCRTARAGWRNVQLKYFNFIRVPDVDFAWKRSIACNQFVRTGQNQCSIAQSSWQWLAQHICTLPVSLEAGIVSENCKQKCRQKTSLKKKSSSLSTVSNLFHVYGTLRQVNTRIRTRKWRPGIRFLMPSA